MRSKLEKTKLGLVDNSFVRINLSFFLFVESDKKFYCVTECERARAIKYINKTIRPVLLARLLIRKFTTFK